MNIKNGDIIKLGRHKIICGDSLKAETYKTLLEDQKPVLCIADPPYGMGKTKSGNVENDNQNQAELLKFNKKWIPLNLQHLTKKWEHIHI